MPNKQYVKGRKKEYWIVKNLRRKGYEIVQRTAGSHSPIDVIAINPKTQEILFVQSKYDMEEKEKLKIEKEMEFLNKLYNVRFKCI